MRSTRKFARGVYVCVFLWLQGYIFCNVEESIKRNPQSKNGSNNVIGKVYSVS